MPEVVLLDTTPAKGEVVIVVVNGMLVYHEDLYDPDSLNVSLEASAVAENLGTALGVEVVKVDVPDSHAGKPVTEIVGWFNEGQAQPARKPRTRRKK